MRDGCILLGLIVSLTACEPTQLYIAHNTVIGLDAAVDTNRQSGRLLFGYDRQFVALAPKSVPHNTDPDCADNKCREAMAALSCNEVEVDGIFLTRFKDNLATGMAATEAAKSINKAADNAVQAVQNAQGQTAEVYSKVIGALFDCWQYSEDEQESSDDEIR